MSKAKIVRTMTRDENLRWFSGGHVRVGTITQVVNGEFKKSFVARVRGYIVSDGEDYLHETVQAARAYGQRIMAQWKAEYKKRKEQGAYDRP